MPFSSLALATLTDPGLAMCQPQFALPRSDLRSVEIHGLCVRLAQRQTGSTNIESTRSPIVRGVFDIDPIALGTSTVPPATSKDNG